MGRRLTVSDGANVQEAVENKYKIAFGGVVKNIKIACVAQGGVVKQYWPPAAGVLTPSEIVWNTTAITVREQVTFPLVATASIVFDRAAGKFTYDSYPDADITGYYLNPPLNGTAGDDAKWLIKVDQVSGTALTGTLGAWIDLNSLATQTWSLAHSGVGSSAAVATITIAEDGGGGSPAAGTSVAKTVNFSAEVIAAGTEETIVWSSFQRDLVEQKSSVDADCDLVFNPDGSAQGFADTSGSFTENWHTDTPAVADPSLFTVNVALVSGTAPTGSALSTNLTLDAVRQWKLLATTSENLSCSLDVTVSDGTASVTKRVTMNSQRAAASATPVWTTTQWNLTDAAFPQALALIQTNTLDFPVAANATGDCVNTEGGGEQENDAWLPGGESASDYEVKVVNTSGADGLISHTSGVWYNLGSGQTFVIEYATVAGSRTRWYEIHIRKIGDIAVVKPLKIFTAAASGATPP